MFVRHTEVTCSSFGISHKAVLSEDDQPWVSSNLGPVCPLMMGRSVHGAHCWEGLFSTAQMIPNITHNFVPPDIGDHVYFLSYFLLCFPSHVLLFLVFFLLSLPKTTAYAHYSG